MPSTDDSTFTTPDPSTAAPTSAAALSPTGLTLPRERSTRATWIGLLILFVLTFAVFWPILPAEFTRWDDAENISANQLLVPPSWSGLARRWAEPMMNIYIPVVHTVWFALAFLAQTDIPNADGGFIAAWPFKWMNVFTHFATCAIVFFILRRLVRSPWSALLGACLFCVHPLQVESVGWTCGLKDLLFGFFSAAAIYFFLEAGTPRSNSSRRFALSLVMMVLACLSKPTALVLPAMLLVIDLAIHRRSVRESVTRLLPFVVVSIVCAWYARHAQPGPSIAEVATITLRDRLFVPGQTLAFYLCKLVWPTQLAFDYGFNWKHVLASRWYFVAWLLPAAVALAAFAVRKRMPLIGLGLLLALIPLGPVSGLVVFDFSFFSIAADHYLYLPMLGIAIAAAGVLDRVHPRRLFGLAIPILLVLSILSVRQAFTWQTAMRTTLHTLAVNPDSFSSYSILSILVLEQAQGREAEYDRAEGFARRSIELRPEYPRSYNMLANILSARGWNEDALKEIDKAINLSPTEVPFRMARAGILGHLQRGEESYEELKRVLRLDPHHKLADELVKRYEAGARQLKARGIPNATTAPATSRAVETDTGGADADGPDGIQTVREDHPVASVQPTSQPAARP